MIGLEPLHLDQKWPMGRYNGAPTRPALGKDEVFPAGNKL